MRNQNEAKVVALEEFRESREAAVLHEQLALRRLKRSHEAENERRERARAAVILLRPIWRAVKWLFTPVVPVRREGPHLPPVPQSEWDKGARYLQRFF